MTVIGSCNLGYSLPVWDFGVEQVHFQFMGVVEVPFEYVYMMLSLSAQDCLFKLLGILHLYGGILGMGTIEDFAQFLFVLFLFCFDCCTEF
ncbi:hypothetical protein SDC9_88807 [bioreactor metagenome]|uniref:Uncharacterized protein n=1 Tax=bioreactor metagenome TaxID=1076179 RepID=A0A644ZML5_9ZZZZ